MVPLQVPAPLLPTSRSQCLGGRRWGKASRCHRFADSPDCSPPMADGANWRMRHSAPSTDGARSGAPGSPRWTRTAACGSKSMRGDVEPLLVFNGHIFALYGLYDYAMLTGDAHAIDFFDGGATTIRNHIDTIRVPGGISYYCARVRDTASGPSGSTPAINRSMSSSCACSAR